MQCKIVIPSYNRAERVLTTKVCKDVIICVPKSQEDEYKLYNPDVEIVTHPDNIKGLPPKRNWMVQHFGELFMIDDDISTVQKLYISKGESSLIKDKQQVYDIIQRIYRMAKLLGVSVFGFSNNTTPFQYNEFVPFTLTQRITGCSYGVIKNKNTIWNEDIVVKEDFWISSYVLFKERKILVDNRYHFLQKDTFVNPGGLSEFRSSQSEMKSILAIKKHFGDSIVLKGIKSHSNKKAKYNITTKYKI